MEAASEQADLSATRRLLKSSSACVGLVFSLALSSSSSLAILLMCDPHIVYIALSRPRIFLKLYCKDGACDVQLLYVAKISSSLREASLVNCGMSSKLSLCLTDAFAPSSLHTLVVFTESFACEL